MFILKSKIQTNSFPFRFNNRLNIQIKKFRSFKDNSNPADAQAVFDYTNYNYGSYTIIRFIRSIFSFVSFIILKI